MLLDIQKASEYLNVSKETLRRWEKEEKLIPHRTRTIKIFIKQYNIK